MNLNDKILVVFFCVCKQNCNYSKIIERCCSVQATEKIVWQLFNLKKAYFFFFTILRYCKSRKKPLLKQTQQ